MELAEELRLDAEEDVKIEMAPWAKTNIRMDKLYTNLEVDQIEDQPSGKPEYKRLGDYKELFPENETPVGKGKRILVQGDPGSGKTTFAKKIMWDWAKGIFTAVSVVFFVSMKFVRPGDPIQNIIVQQTPSLEELNVSSDRLKLMLNTFGGRFLIILDGFDENFSNKDENEDVMRLLQGRNFRKCKILLTSRPHTTADIRSCFQIVLQIQGFTKEKAREFASRTLLDQTKIKDVLEIRCLNAGEYIQKGDSVFTCPILLLFVCVLTNHNEIDLSQKVFSLGEIYSRVVRCLYRKYTVRNEKQFSHSDFVDVLFKVGLVAAEILSFKRFGYRRSDILKSVGDDAFEYGLLIGHEDFRLMGDEAADIVIDFPHRTIQEFLAAFFSVETRNRREQKNFDKNSLSWFPLVLHFCLWLLGKDTSKTEHRSIFSFDRRKEIYKTVQTFMCHQIDYLQLEFHTMKVYFPSLDVESAYKCRDEIRLNFLKDVLSKCKKIRYIRFGESQVESVGWMIQAIRPLSSQLLLINFGWDNSLKQPHLLHGIPPEYISVVICPLRMNYLQEVLKHLTDFDKPLLVTCDFTVKREASHIAVWPTEAARFNIQADGSEISVPQNIPHSPSLTHLSLCGLNLSEELISVLGNALQNQRLPMLSHLNFTGSDVKGKLSKLLEEQMKDVVHLNLNKCYLDLSDIQALHRMGTAAPNLKSFTLFLGDRLDDSLGAHISLLPLQNMYACVKWVRDNDEALLSALQAPWPSLTELWLHEVNKNEYKAVVAVLNQGKFREIRELGISMWKHVDVHKDVQIPVASHIVDAKTFEVIRISAETEHLEPVNVETLTHLTLHRFICTMQHLYMVTQSKILTQLHKLDISHSSGITGFLLILLGHNMPCLNTLIVSDCALNSKDLRSLAQAKVNCRLPELKHLNISENEELTGNLECLFDEAADWTQLKTLNVLQNFKTKSKSDFECVATRAHSGYLKSLSELHIATTDVEILSNGKWEKLDKLFIITNRVGKILRDISEAHRKGLLTSLSTVQVDIKGDAFGEALKNVLLNTPQSHVTDTCPLDTRIFAKMLHSMGQVSPSVLDTVRMSKEMPSEHALMDVCLEQIDIVSLVNSELSQPMSEEQGEILNDAFREMLNEYIKQDVLTSRKQLMRQGVLVQYRINAE